MSSVSSTSDYSVPSVSQDVFPEYTQVALIVTTIVVGVLAGLALVQVFSPYTAIAAVELGLGELGFVAVWYSSKSGSSSAIKPNPNSIPIPGLSTSASSSSDEVNWWDLDHASSSERNSSSSSGSDSYGHLLTEIACSPLQGETVRNSWGYPLLPLVGEYADYSTMLPDQHLVSYRLPRSQLAGFPQPMRRYFADHEHLDLFLFVTRDSRGHHSAWRNLVTHFWVFPDHQTGDDVSKWVQIHYFEPTGIEPVNAHCRERVHLHPTRAISPNNARFQVTAAPGEDCGFYVAIEDGKRACLFYMILQRGEALSSALQSWTLSDFYSSLEESSFKENIEKLLRQY
ncbi:MAG: hypothetical protein S4CHLAM2_00690 [Chlamydiales bacterium]|nr:hypothetical protein [Chlamydiales bacterium]